MRELLDLQAEYEAHQNSLVTLANDIQQEEEIVRELLVNFSSRTVLITFPMGRVGERDRSV